MTHLDAHAYTFGIEEEFFLVDPATRDVVADVPKELVRSCRRSLGDSVTHELLQSQIEISSPVFRDCAEAREEMIRLRRGIAEIASERGLRLLAAGTAPLARWPEQRHTDKPHYRRLIDDFQIVAYRNLLCGLHIHVAVPEGVDRVDLMNRMMPWLPVFLALSTSSPFWDRQRTGLMSYRQAAYDEWPRTGIPDHFADEAEYQGFVDLLVGNGAAESASSLWWAIRPSERYPTLELRITDSCTRIEDSLAIAALLRCLVRAHVRRPELGCTHTVYTRRLIDENRWRAKRYGTAAEFIDADGSGTRPFEQIVADLAELIAEDVEALGCHDAVRQMQRIVAEGTSAHEQIRIYRARRDAGVGRFGALKSVVDWLVETTVPAAA